MSDGGREGQEAMHLHSHTSCLEAVGFPTPLPAAAALLVTKGKRQTKGSILAHSTFCAMTLWAAQPRCPVRDRRLAGGSPPAQPTPVAVTLRNEGVDVASPAAPAAK